MRQRKKEKEELRGERNPMNHAQGWKQAGNKAILARVIRLCGIKAEQKKFFSLAVLSPPRSNECSWLFDDRVAGAVGISDEEKGVSVPSMLSNPRAISAISPVFDGSFTEWIIAPYEMIWGRKKP